MDRAGLRICDARGAGTYFAVLLIDTTGDDEPDDFAVAEFVLAKSPAKVTLTVSTARVRTGGAVTLTSIATYRKALLLGGAPQFVRVRGAVLTVQYRLRGTTTWHTIRSFTAPTGGWQTSWRYPLRYSAYVRTSLRATTFSPAATSSQIWITRVG